MSKKERIEVKSSTMGILLNRILEKIIYGVLKIVNNNFLNSLIFFLPLTVIMFIHNATLLLMSDWAQFIVFIAFFL